MNFLILTFFSSFLHDVVIKIESPLTSLQLTCATSLTLNLKYPEKVRNSENSKKIQTNF